MATLAIAGLGAAIGYGATGTALGLSIGWSVGSYLGSVLFPTQLPDVEGPRITDLSAGNSAYGIPRTRIWGTIGVAGNMIWSDDLTEIRNSETQGGGKGGGGSEQTVITYTYTVSSAWALCEGPVDAVRRIWFDSELVYDRRETNQGISVKDGLNVRIYLGTEEQLPDPTIEAIEGVGDTPAYRGTCYIVVTDLLLTEYGNRRPNVRAEVVREGPGVSGATQYAAESRTVIGFDKITGWVYIQNQTNGVVWVHDAYSGTLISTWVAASGLFGWDDMGMASAHNGFIYGQEWYDGNNQYISSHDMATGQRVWQSGSNQGGLGVGDTTLWAHDEWLITSGVLTQERVTIWEYNADGSASVVLTTIDVAADEGEAESSQVEPDTGYVWVLYGWGGGGGYEQGLQRIKLDLNPEYPYFSGTKWLTDVQTIGLNDAFDSNGDYTGTGVKADNFYQVSPYFFAYDPTTQSVLLDQLSDDSGTALAAGMYRIECTTRHDLTTSRIAASRAYGSGLFGTVTNQSVNIGNEFLGDGRGYRWMPGNELLEFNTSDLTTIKTHTWSTGDLSNNLANRAHASWDAGIFFGFVLNDGDHKIFWDRSPDTGMGLDVVVSEICTTHNLDATEIDVTDLASKSVRGFAVARPTKARTQIEMLMGAYLFDAVESDKKLKFNLKGQTSLVTINEDDLAAHEPGKSLPDDLVLKRKELYQLPETVQITHLSRELEYEASNQYARQPTSPVADILKLEFPIVFSDDEAAQLAEKWLQALRSERHSGSIALGPYYFEYDPTDIITVNRGGITYQFRIAKTAYGGLPGITKVDVSSYDATAYNSNAVGSAPIGYNLATLNQAPISAFFMVNSPPLRDQDDDGGFYAVMAPYVDPGNWPGAVLQRRDAANDTDQYVNIATAGNRGVVGAEATGTALPTGPNATTWDWTNSINVLMWNNDALASDTELNVLNGKNLMYFPQSGELMSFQTATLETDGTYTLTGLLRGRRGTDYAMDDHLPSEPIVAIDPNAIYKVDDIVSNVGRTFTYAAVSFGSSLVRSRKENWTQLGGLITPLSPVGLEAQRETNGDLSLSWIRRARLNAEWLDNVDVPLDEPTEEYDVELYQGTTLVRTERVISANTHTYTAAEQNTDLGDLIGEFNFCVYQISSRVGRGRAGCLEPILEPLATNFDPYNVLELPANWVEEGNVGSSEWDIRDAGSGDHFLRSTRSSAGHNFAKWLRVTNARDIEVLIKTRTALNPTGGGSGTNSIHGVILRANTLTDAGVLAGFWGNTGRPAVTLWDGIGGSSGYSDTYTENSKLMITSTWWWCRVRLQGPDLKVKWWADGGAEPGAWDYETTQTTYPDAGNIMLAGANEYWGGPEDFDFFSIAYNGQTAPNTV